MIGRFKVLLPEHVTVRMHGASDGKHLYIFRPGAVGEAPAWKRDGNRLEYAKDFGEIHFLARVTLTEDGILFHYEFVNHSKSDYDMVTAVTDPRFRAVFYDPRLERTYVHTTNGFELLASDAPGTADGAADRVVPGSLHGLVHESDSGGSSATAFGWNYVPVPAGAGRCTDDCDALAGWELGGSYVLAPCG